MAAVCSLDSSFVLLIATLMTGKFVGVSTFQPRRLVTKLIHRDSNSSPYYNPNETVADRMARAMKTSAARIAYLYGQTKRDINVNNFQLNLLPSSSEPLFLVNFSIGQPPVQQFTIMDTGSNLLWVQCAPCKGCSPHTGTLLDPSISSTYASLSCWNSVCHYAPGGGNCNLLNQCVYNQSYIKGLPSLGVLATEQVIFQGSDEDKNIVPNVLFGCSYENGKYKDNRFTGVFGLGNEITSLVTQMGSKFSYCLGNIADPDYRYNQLVLGEEANIEGSSTPLEVVDGHYHVTLEGISVGEKRLNIDYTACRRGTGEAAIIDSGTALTWLAEVLYTALATEVRNLLDGFLKPIWRESFLCYSGRVQQDLIGFPVVTLHFTGGADLELGSESVFYQATPNILCMSVRQVNAYGNDFKDVSVIGLMAQQYYNVAYDLSNSKLFFQRIDCELLAY